MSDPPLTGRTMSPDSERAKGLLKLANYARVAEVLGVSRASVARWAKGEQVTPWQLQRLQELLGRNDESAPPEWAERLLAGVMSLETKSQVTDEELDRAVALASAWLAIAEQRRQRRPEGGGGEGATGA